MAKVYEKYISYRKRNMATRATNKNKVAELFKTVFRRIECEANNELDMLNEEWAKDEVKYKFRMAMLITSI